MTPAERVAFRAIDAAGLLHRGTLEAASLSSARHDLAARGLLAVELRRATPRPWVAGQLSLEDLASGLATLAELLDAGVTLTQALAVMEPTSSAAWQRAIPTVRRGLQEGQSLSVAMVDAGVRIPPAVLGLLRVGDLGHGHAAAVRRASEHAARRLESRRAIIAALSYPAVVTVVGVGAVGAIVWGVLPRFAAMIHEMGQTLPRATELLLVVSQRSADAVPLVIALGALAATAISRLSDRGVVRGRVDELWLRLPLWGVHQMRHRTAMFCDTLGALLEAGVPATRALDVAAHATADTAIIARTDAAGRAVRDGERLSRALEQHHVVSPFAVQLVRAGEESGRIVPMLQRAALMERQRFVRDLAALTRLLEPTLLVAFAGIVGIVASGLLQAVYAVNPR